MGEWIARKWKVCAKRKVEAEQQLNESVYTQEELQSFWRDQVDVQTRPLVAATATLAKRTIQSILDSMDYIKSIDSEIDSLDRLMDGQEGD